MKLYFASDFEERAVNWARAYYPRWIQQHAQSVSEKEREIRLNPILDSYPHAARWAARPFGNSEMNRKALAVRHCLRRNTHFRKLARVLQKRNAA